MKIAFALNSLIFLYDTAKSYQNNIYTVIIQRKITMNIKQENKNVLLRHNINLQRIFNAKS